MAIISSWGSQVVNLSNAQTGNGPSTNVADRGARRLATLLKIVTTIGATPTCTYAIEGSPDSTSWFAVSYADAATPQTLSVATFVITTATTAFKVIPPDIPVRFVRVSYSSNTNVTSTIDLYS